MQLKNKICHIYGHSADWVHDYIITNRDFSTLHKFLKIHDILTLHFEISWIWIYSVRSFYRIPLPCYERENEWWIFLTLHFEIIWISFLGFHCHATKEKTSVDKRARRKLIIASTLCVLFMIGETVGKAFQQLSGKKNNSTSCKTFTDYERNNIRYICIYRF